MLDPAKRHLTLLFTVTILALLALCTGGTVYYFHFNLHRSEQESLRHELAEDVLPYVAAERMEALAEVADSDLFQVLDASGLVVVESVNPLGVDPPINPALLRRALAGGEAWERVTLFETTVLVYYFPLAPHLVVRAVASLEALVALERTALLAALVGFPLMLLLAYGLSRLLVARAMGPVRDAMTYQELFSANVSHELLSPLTALKGGLEVSLRRPRDAEDYRRALVEGLSQANRLVELIRNLELLSSAHFHRTDLMLEPQVLTSLVEASVAARRAALEALPLTVTVRSAESVECWLDRVLLRRVLDNLLDNALKYAVPGSTLVITQSRQRRSVRLTFDNACRPLPAARRAGVFEPFERGQPDVPGRGLGLFVARHIARAHGGDLTLLPSAEARFVVQLALPCPPA